MTNFFEKLKETITDTAEVVSKRTGEVVDVVAKKTEQTVEVQKLKGQISTMERNNERDYRDIGKIIYSRFKNGEGADAEYIELCDAIAEREEAIAKAKQEIAGLKGLDVCPSCATHNEANAKYCQECGTKLDEEGSEEVEDSEEIFETDFKEEE